MRVSIIIPVHDRFEELEIGLASLKDSEIAPFNIIIVDNSRDGLPIRSQGLQDVVSVREHGVPTCNASAARNLGARLASGSDLLLFLDADMIADRGLVSAHLKFHCYASRRAVGLGARRLLTAESTRSILVSRDVSNLDKTDYTADERQMFLNAAAVDWGCLYSHNFSIRPSFFHEVGGFDPQFVGCGGEDVDLGYRLGAAGGEFTYLPHAYGYHQHHLRSSERWRSNLENLERLVRKHPALIHFGLEVLSGWRDRAPEECRERVATLTTAFQER